MSDGKGTQTICPTCGATFQRRVKGQTYCSRKCSAKARYANRHETEKAYGVCRVCGKSLKGCKRRKTYCSDECAKIAAKDRDSRARNNQRYEHQCPECGKIFRAGVKERKYCSVPCKRNGMKKTVGETVNRRNGGEDDRGQTVLLVVKRTPQVNREFRPRVGQIYTAVRYQGHGTDVIVVPGFGKYGLILRPDEVKILKG